MLKITPEFLLNLINIPIESYIDQVGYYMGVCNSNLIFIPSFFPLKLPVKSSLNHKFINIYIHSEYKYANEHFKVCTNEERTHIKKINNSFNVSPIITDDTLADVELVNYYSKLFDRLYVIPIARYSCRI